MEESYRQSLQQPLNQLSQLSRVIGEQSSTVAISTMKKFIQLYVRYQNQSEDFFMSLCEYQIVPRLFGLYAKGVLVLQILEVFNLLLANTSKSGHLVYLFSQPTMHDFMFEKVKIEKQHGETVEYYVQLLKTMIMKLSQEQNNSMIKLFCNLRYPHFPLLTVVASLGVGMEHEELVRVTANQCVLLLIKVMNSTEIGLEYLCELQMMVYYHQLLQGLFGGTEEDCQQNIRFMVDLLLSLRRNLVSLCMFMNLLTNHLLFRHGYKPQKILNFLGLFYDHLLDHQQFPQELAEEIILVLSRIITKLMGGGRINYTYFTAQRTLPFLVIPQKPNLMKYFVCRCKKIQEYLIRQMAMLQDQKELQFVFEQWLHFNYRNKQMSPLRDMKIKPKSAFTQFFTSKDESMDEYIKSVMTLAGLERGKLKGPIYKLSFSSDYQTSLYLVQLVCTRFQERVEHQPKAQGMYGKQQMFQIEPTQEFLLQLYNIISRVTRNKVEIHHLPSKTESRLRKSRQSTSSRGSIDYSRVKGFLYIFQHLRLPLVNIFVQVLSSKQSKPPSLSQFCLISAISSKMNLSQLVNFMHAEPLLAKLKQLQMYITEDVFNQQNFHFAYKYITKNRQKALLKKVERQKEGDPPSPKKKMFKIKNRIESNFIQYEIIKRLINGSVKSLTEFIQEYWQIRFFSENKGVVYPVTQFLYKESNGTILEVIADNCYEFALKLTKNAESSTYSISRDDCNLDKNNPTLVSFEDHNYLINFQSEKKANNFREDIGRLRKQRLELIMSGMLQYLTFSYQSLAVSYSGTKQFSSCLR